ncbi:MAG: glutaredoxin family protein [Sideroxydans sp.]|nr:glutaredoxin family protein [Sideroxydans sp.]
MKFLFLICTLFLLGNAQAGELYRSIDSSGKVHYSDKPLPASDDVERLKSGKEPVPDDTLPYETMRAKQNFPVTLYVFPDCSSACQQARDFLNKRGIPFSEVNLITQEDIDSFRKASGSSSAPALLIGKNWLIGFLAEQWNKELDFAGYPKSAPYRAKPAIPAAKTEPATSP